MSNRETVVNPIYSPALYTRVEYVTRAPRSLANRAVGTPPIRATVRVGGATSQQTEYTMLAHGLCRYKQQSEMRTAVLKFSHWTPNSHRIPHRPASDQFTTLALWVAIQAETAPNAPGSAGKRLPSSTRPPARGRST